MLTTQKMSTRHTPDTCCTFGYLVLPTRVDAPAMLVELLLIAARQPPTTMLFQSTVVLVLPRQLAVVDQSVQQLRHSLADPLRHGSRSLELCRPCVAWPTVDPAL